MTGMEGGRPHLRVTSRHGESWGIRGQALPWKVGRRHHILGTHLSTHQRSNYALSGLRKETGQPVRDPMASRQGGYQSEA
jgi:hypothetical protein